MEIAQATQNTSGQGDAATLPAGIDKWNWGAFLLNWIWGLGNRTYISLLMFVPLVNFIMAFALGLKGSAWAWRNKQWDSVEHFRAVQKKWAWWGVGIWALWIALAVGAYFAATALMKGSDAYRLALMQVQNSAEVEGIVGTPMQGGTPSGQMEATGANGSAQLSFDVTGPTGAGTVFVTARKPLGVWKIDELVFENAASGERIELSE